MDSIKQFLAWRFYRLDKFIVSTFKLKESTFLYYWALDLDVREEIIPPIDYYKHLGI